MKPIEIAAAVLAASLPLARAGAQASANGITRLSSLPLSAFGTQSSANDCWGYVSATGREYAILGLSGGTGFAEISDPTNPVVVATIAGPASSWRDIETYGAYAYAVSEGGSGIQVIGLGQIDAGVVTHAGYVNTPGTGATHTLSIDPVSGFLYRSGGGNEGLRIYSLANPASPSYVASWSASYVHDVHPVTYTTGPLAGRQIAYAFTGSSGAVHILDVTNKSSIQLLRVVAWPNGAYSHQGWLSADRRYLYIDDELDEPPLPTTTYVVDVQDPANASYVGSFTNGNTAIGHNLFVEGDLIYEANYRSGLRVFDATNPTAPVEAYWYDTYPADDQPEFDSLWSVYPYLPSGVVIGSDIEQGLWVWWIGPPLVELAFDNGAPTAVRPSGESFAVTITESSPGLLVSGSPTLHYDPGSGFQAAPLAHLGGASYLATFPSLACGTSVAFYLSAESSNGMTWNGPDGGASSPFVARVAYGASLVLEDDLETNQGWVVGYAGDNATTGVWTRVDPVGTAAQPEDDHTPAPGAMCFVTGQGAVGGGLGDNDVDNGTTTLLTPVLDLSAASEPVAGYWRWYSNNTGASPGADVFTVDVTNNGSTWVHVETVGPTGPGTTGGWVYHEFRVRDFVAPTASVRVRFVASDLGSGSIVEAAVDDFRIDDLVCQAPIASYCTARVNSLGCAPTVGYSGTPSASASSGFVVSCADVINRKSGLLFYGMTGRAAAPFHGGTRCVATPLYRTPIQDSGGSAPGVDDCSGVWSLDMNAFASGLAGGNPAPALAVAGTVVDCQLWGRDPGYAPPDNAQLSNALEYVVEP